MANDTYLTKAQVGRAFHLFRMRGTGIRPMPSDEIVERLPGLFRSARAANTALRAIAAATGEPIL